MQLRVEEIRFDSDGIVLYGRRRRPGPGRPMVVLLPGIGFHTFEYEPLAEQLAERDIGTLSVDLRGHGRSGGRRGDWRLADLAADACRAVAEAGAAGGAVHVFGNSLGAMVGLLAGGRDDRVRSVVASNAPAHVARFMLSPWRRTLYAVARPAARCVAFRVGLHHFYDYDDLIEDPSWIERIRSDPLVGPARRLTLATYGELLERWDGPAAVRAVRCPLLILNGSRDRFQPAEQTEQLLGARDPRPVHRSLDAGHLPHLDDPAAVADMVAWWVAAPGGRGDRPRISG